MFYKILFWYSFNGFRGSHVLWRIRDLLKAKPKEMLILPTGFPMFINKDDWISKTISWGTYERALLHCII